MLVEKQSELKLTVWQFVSCRHHFVGQSRARGASGVPGKVSGAQEFLVHPLPHSIAGKSLSSRTTAGITIYYQPNSEINRHLLTLKL